MVGKYKNIVWDWNGTLLDDVAICVASMNQLLEERSLPKLSNEKYKKVFTFPVKKYYEAIGFDFNTEPFDGPALKFIDYYHKYLPSVGLFEEVKLVLDKLKSAGYRQYILSAMEQNALLSSVCNLGIAHYFEEIVGIADHFARSKVNAGKKLTNGHINIPDSIMIGDTLHDMEVAEELGISCILVAQGHQSADRLKINGNIVLGDLKELLDYL